MLPSLSCAESEHPTRQNTWVCLTLFSSYLTSSCRPANWEREQAPHFRQPDVLPDDGQRSRYRLIHGDIIERHTQNLNFTHNCENTSPILP